MNQRKSSFYSVLSTWGNQLLFYTPIEIQDLLGFVNIEHNILVSFIILNILLELKITL